MRLAFLMFVIILVGVASNTSALMLAQDHSPGYDLALHGSYAYVSNNFGVAIYDISNPNAPSRLSEFSLGGPAGGIAIAGDILYVAGFARGLVIANISDSPTSPIILAEHTASDYITKVCVIGNYAYITSGFGVVQVLDISNPNNPDLLDELTLSGLTLGMAVQGSTIYVAQPESGLKIIDASDKNSLQFHSTVSLTSDARDIHIQGDLLYLARGSSGVDILNISSPSNPELIGHFNDGGSSQGISGDSHYICVADLQQGIELLNISDASEPTEHTNYADAAPHDVIYSERFAYVADQDDEFKIIDFTSIIPEYTEPIIPSTSISDTTPTTTGASDPTTTEASSPEVSSLELIIISVSICTVIIISLILIRKRQCR